MLTMMMIMMYFIFIFYALYFYAVVQLVEYRTRNQEVVGSTHTRYTASNLE